MDADSLKALWRVSRWPKQAKQKPNAITKARKKRVSRGARILLRRLPNKGYGGQEGRREKGDKGKQGALISYFN